MGFNSGFKGLISVSIGQHECILTICKNRHLLYVALQKVETLPYTKKERPDDDPEIKRVETCCPIPIDIKKHQKQLCFD